VGPPAHPDELALLGYRVAELTVAKHMHRASPRPSLTWRAFLAAHARDIVAVDFFLVPPLTPRHAQLEQLAMDSGAPYRGLAAAIWVTSARISGVTGGRPTTGRWERRVQ
jgi:hypothetical protein